MASDFSLYTAAKAGPSSPAAHPRFVALSGIRHAWQARGGGRWGCLLRRMGGPQGIFTKTDSLMDRR